jgi:DNA polymerase I
MDMENDDLLEYCKRDVQITNILYNKIKNLSFNWEESLTLEHEFATVIERQVAHGFHFNQVEGAKLYAKLLEDRTKVASELRTVFGSWYQPDGEFTPKKK